VNIRSREEIRASADLLANVVNLFVRASYAARVNAASLTERAEIISSLGKIYFCDYYYLDLAARPLSGAGRHGRALHAVADRLPPQRLVAAGGRQPLLGHAGIPRRGPERLRGSRRR
jgi:hypothetical protein